jgi:hypothetical protein
VRFEGAVPQIPRSPGGQVLDSTDLNTGRPAVNSNHCGEASRSTPPHACRVGEVVGLAHAMKTPAHRCGPGRVDRPYGLARPARRSRAQRPNRTGEPKRPGQSIGSDIGCPRCPM